MNIIGMMAVYNESDIVSQSVAHMISQGIPLVVLDNSSTDGSYEIVSELLGKGVISVERFRSEKFELVKILQRLWGMATALVPDWVVLCCPDEFLESPSRNLTLKEAIEREAAQAYNMIQFTNFEFMLTEVDRDSQEKDVRKRLRYYTMHDDLHFRAFKFYKGTTIHDYAGDFPIFPIDIEVNISPHKFVLRHYRFRSYEHGLKKVFEDRLPRYSPDELSRGWHVHYKRFKKDIGYFVINSKELTRYEEDGKWNPTRTFDPNLGTWTAPDVRLLLSEITVLRRKLDERTGLAQRLDREVKEAKNERAELVLQLSEARNELQMFRQSFGYAFMKFYSSRIDRLFPDGTSRGELRKMATASVQLLRRVGLRGFLRQALDKGQTSRESRGG